MSPAQKASNSSEISRLRELIRISAAVGKDSSLVLGAFGNTSVKTADGKYMYIKASGTALKDMTEAGGWRRLKVEPALAILKDKSLSKMSIDEREAKVVNGLRLALDDKIKSGAMPSIETCFHSMLDRYVIHLHPVAVLGYACAKNGQAELGRLFKKEEFLPLWVPYADVGYKLAKRIEKLTCNYKAHYGRGPAIMFLQNHGLVVTSNSPNSAMRLVHETVNICSSKLKHPSAVKIKPASNEAITEAIPAIRRAVLGTTGKHPTVTHFIDEIIAGFMAEKNTARFCSLPAITPDELLYCHGPAMWLDKWDRQTILNKLNRLGLKGRETPVAFLIKPLGLFVTAEKRQRFIKDVVCTYLSVRSLAARLGGIQSLSLAARRSLLFHLRTGHNIVENIV